MDAPDESDIFHAGERLMQTRAGVQDRMASLGPHAIRSAMPAQHREFFAQLPFVIAGSVDASGQPWASILTHPPGFIASPDARHVLIRAWPRAPDPLCETLTVGAAIALLGIEQHTRRRNRLNGIVERVDDAGVLVAVHQSFGNCSKYIQARQLVYREGHHAGLTDCGTDLTAHSRALIAHADTLFIASAHPASNPRRAPASAINNQGVDVAHRGGKPGFVRVDGTSLTCPDFAGNHFFNTLGNILLNPRAGLLFIDFEQGDLLYLAADAEIISEGPELAAFAGAERLLRFEIREFRYAPRALPLRWRGEVQLSPFLERTGQWGQSETTAPRTSTPRAAGVGTETDPS
ncbi:MAG: pyridoxamine 5'-phosphate oxidase family protein [Thiobacillus sp.]|nr:pyridoxamine 5'-phosphate oxidase family protein [Thiobacillus sp.]